MISFVIRTLNEGAYIERTLREIRSQIHDDPVETVIVDSGSTDDTLVIAAKYGAKIVHISKADWSWGRSLNLGIRNATGDIIVIVSGHCYLTTNHFVSNAISQLNGYDAIYGKQLPLPRMDPFEEFELACWYPDDKLINLNAERLVGVSNACCVMRKSAWAIQQFDEHAQSMEDGMWAYSALGRGMKLAYTSTIAVYHSHRFEQGHIYRRWYARTLESKNFGSVIYEKNWFYNFKQSIKKNFLLPIIFIKYSVELRKLLGFQSENSRLGFRMNHLFLLLKYTAIFKANQDFSRSTQKRYWECRQPAWLGKHAEELDKRVLRYLGESRS
jgi:rhamnosyltransferase